MLIVALGLFIHSGVALADLQSNHDRAILRAAMDDVSFTNKEKLTTHRCQMIEKYLGYEDSVDGKAMEYSCQNDGVGITLYVGEDLDAYTPEQVAQHFIGKLELDGLPAEVFIKRHYFVDRGGNKHYDRDTLSFSEWVNLSKALVEEGHAEIVEY